MLGVTYDIEPRVLDPAVDSSKFGHHSGLNVAGEHLAFGAVVISFQTVRAGFTGVVIVDAYKNGFAVFVPKAGAARQGNKDIAATCHLSTDALFLEIILKSQGCIQGEVLFIHLAVECAFVMTSVSCVNDDVAKALRLEKASEESKSE